jgi:ubiquinone/menaquinone biosynthesis C-methylase UbiE
MRYDDTKIPEDYDSGRKLPTKTMEMWLEAIAKNIPKDRIGRILDVGCGTGRFSYYLSKFFNSDLIGIDPSKKMLLKA